MPNVNFAQICCVTAVFVYACCHMLLYPMHDYDIELNNNC